MYIYNTLEDAAEGALADFVAEDEAVVDQHTLGRVLKLIRLVHGQGRVLFHFIPNLLF